MDRLKMFQGTQKSQFYYFSRDHDCEVTAKNV